MTPAQKEEFKAKLEARIAHMKQLAADIDKTLPRVPNLLFLNVLAVPMFFWKGGVAAFFTCFLIFSLAICSWYLMGTRRAWYRSEIKDLRRELKDLDRSA